MDRLVDALIRLNDAFAMMGMRNPSVIWLESREQGLILFTMLSARLKMMDQKPAIAENAYFGDWCEIMGIKFRWPP